MASAALNRFFHRGTIVVTAFATLAAATAAAAEDTPWTRHVIGAGQGPGGFIGADGVRLGDLNGDGLLDLVSGFEGSSITRAFLHPGLDGDVTGLWPAVSVGSTPNVEDALFVDIDGDGRLDVVSSDESGAGNNPKGQIRVHYAPTGNADLLDPSNWMTTAIPAAANVTEWMYAEALQIDGQRGLDLIVAGKNDNQGSGAPTSEIGWLRAPVDPRNDPNGWEYFRLDDVGWTMSVVTNDMDGDGDMDVLLSDRMGSDASVRWLENPTINPNGKFLISPWTAHTVGLEGGAPGLLAVGDLNGDQLEDIVVPTIDRRLLWYERLDDTGVSWAEHEITWPTTFGEGKAVAIADVNGDGLLDLVVSSKSIHIDEPGLVWLEYVDDPTNPDWIRHDLSGADYGKYDLIQMIDVDGDGDLDAITTEEQVNGNGLGVVWYENPLGVVPEPTAASLLGVAGAVLLSRRSRRPRRLQG